MVTDQTVLNEGMTCPNLVLQWANLWPTWFRTICFKELQAPVHAYPVESLIWYRTFYLLFYTHLHRDKLVALLLHDLLHATKLVINLEGGDACSNKDDCIKRCAQHTVLPWSIRTADIHKFRCQEHKKQVYGWKFLVVRWIPWWGDRNELDNV